MAVNYPCSTYKTAQIVLVPPAIAPKNGYKVKWRVQGATEWNLYPNQTGTTINVVGVPSCYNIEVSIQPDCDGGNGSENIILVGTSTTCYTYILNTAGTYQFTPCGSTSGVVMVITSAMTTAEKTFCIVDNTLASPPGASVTKSTQCTTP